MRFFRTRRADQQPAAYAQYTPQVWIPGTPSINTGGRISAPFVPYDNPHAFTPARQPYQAAPAVLYVAPEIPPPTIGSNTTPTPWQPAAQADIQAYYFLRAPTAQEAIVGPQYNAAQPLGMM